MLKNWLLHSNKGLFAFLCISLVTGCLSFGGATQWTPTTPNFCGKVVYVPTEGGFYGLESSKGNKYLPVNLPDNLKQHGLSIQARLVKVQDMMGLHMWGEYVRILDVKPFPC